MTCDNGLDTNCVLCAVRRPLPLLAWVALPVLFTAAVLGLTSLGALLLGMPSDATLTSAHLGTAAGLTAMVGFAIEWPAKWRWLHWPYPALVFVAGVVLHGLTIPAIATLGLGIPSAALLLHVTWLHKSLRRQTPIAS